MTVEMYDISEHLDEPRKDIGFAIACKCYVCDGLIIRSVSPRHDIELYYLKTFEVEKGVFNPDNMYRYTLGEGANGTGIYVSEEEMDALFLAYQEIKRRKNAKR